MTTLPLTGGGPRSRPRLELPLFALSPQLLRINLLSGLTVALAMVPEAIAFALVVQVSPLTGLYAAFIVALITSSLGGRPGMISGATGSLAVVMVALWWRSTASSTCSPPWC